MNIANIQVFMMKWGIIKPLHSRISESAFSLSSPVSAFRILFCCVVFCLFVSQSAVAEENLTCGVILPLSGESGTTGTDLLHGIEIAAHELNERSHQTGLKVDLRVADDEGSPERALTLFREMQHDKIAVVIGSYSTTLTFPMAKETLNSDTTLLISPQANGEALNGISPLFFQVNSPVFPLARFVADWLVYTADRPAVIYTDDEYGRSMMNHLTGLPASSSLSGRDFYPVPEGETDYAAFVKSVINGAPDAIVIIIYDSRQIPLIRNLSEAGYRGQVLLTESSYIQTLGQDETDALSRFPLCTISSYTNLVPGTHTDRFVSMYSEKYGTEPNMTLAGYGYDSLMIIADSLQRPGRQGNITAEQIRKSLQSSRYYGVTGPKVFDSHNVPTGAIDRWAFSGGKFVLMTTSLV